MTTKRDMVEATINSVITNYRSSTTETATMVAMAMAVLDAGDVFKPLPATTKQEPVDFTYVRISAWVDNDEDYGVDLYCDRCADNLDSIDECALGAVVDTAINHIKEHHDG